MDFRSKNAAVFYTAGKKKDTVTDMCIAAHQDDIEIMAFAPISECYDSESRSFCGVVMTDGAGSPRSGEFADYTDEQMKAVRLTEQQSAAQIGRYSCVIQLGYPSADVKDPENDNTVEDIVTLLRRMRPERLYTHNIADKHPTHVACALRVIEAVRRLDPDERPESVTALEVWRGLDWLPDSDKVCLDTSAYPEIALQLLQVHRSQVAGGKRYDNAAIGRRYANATFFESHGVDGAESLSFGLDLMPLIESSKSPSEYIDIFIDRFREEVHGTLERLWKND